MYFEVDVLPYYTSVEGLTGVVGCWGGCSDTLVTSVLTPLISYNIVCCWVEAFLKFVLFLRKASFVCISTSLFQQRKVLCVLKLFCKGLR